MTQFRKVIFGYDAKQVKQHLRKLKFHRELEISELEQLILKERKKITHLNHESIPPQNMDLNPSVEIAVGLIEEVELVDVMEEVEEEIVEEIVAVAEETETVEETLAVEEEIVTVEEEIVVEAVDVIEDVIELDRVMAPPILLQAESNPMGRLLMFRRKLDSTMDQDEHQSSSDQNRNQDYWESIDQYLETPAISESLLHSQSVVNNSHSQSQHAITNSAVGLPRYFDYDLSEAKTQVYMDPPQPIERRVRSSAQGTPSIPTKIISRDTSNMAVKKSPDTSVNSSVQSQASNEITREVRLLRYKYIVGKWAGEDLLTNRGEVIIHKHNTITEEIVDAAHLEGKLALLIVQMVIPGLGEDI